MSDGYDQSGFFGDGNKFQRLNQARLGMLPAQQRFHSANLAVCKSILGWYMRMNSFLSFNGLSGHTLVFHGAQNQDGNVRGGVFTMITPRYRYEYSIYGTAVL